MSKHNRLADPFGLSPLDSDNERQTERKGW
jgi:hypothetical protein